MDIYVCDGQMTPQFVKLCKSLILNSGLTKEQLVQAGFTHYTDDWYFCRRVNKDKHCPASFSINISPDLEEITEINLLDENFLQPCVCTKKFYEKVLEYINQLKNKKIIETK